MKRSVLVSGATGNVGKAILKQLKGLGVSVTAGVRDIQRARKSIGGLVSDFERVDFGQEQPLDRSERFDSVFLMRPPALADARRYFGPFLRSLSPHTHVVFLSVQGAGTQSYLPHAKIEKLIVEAGLPHTFLRPSYFMENLTTTLRGELERNHRIFLPSGNLAFNWIAIDDIAEVGTKALVGETEEPVLTITNTVEHGFEEIIETINRQCGTNFRYESPHLIRYVGYELSKGTKPGYILIMLLLHYLPRFRKPLGITHDFERITGRPPIGIREFVNKNCLEFQELK